MNTNIYRKIKLKNFLEKNTVLFVLSYIILLTTFNTILKIVFGTRTNFSLIYIYLNGLSFFIFFILILWIVQIFSRNSSITVSIKGISSIYWLLGLSPVFTYLMGGMIHPLKITTWSNSIDILVIETVFNSGLAIVYLVAILTGYMIWRCSDGNVAKRGTHSFLGVISSLAAFIIVFSQLELLGISAEEITSLMYKEHLEILFLALFLQLILIILSFSYFWRRSILKNYVSNMKVLRSVHFMAMTIIGFIILSQLNYEVNFVFEIYNIPKFVFPPLCMVMTWQFTAMINDMYDIGIDRIVHPNRPLVTGDIDSKLFSNIAVTIAVLSILISLYIGITLMILNLTFMLAALAYSVPPVRLKERAYGYICVGYASVVALLFGVYSPIYWSLSLKDGRFFLIEGVPFFREVLSISVIIFLTLSISPYINALSDYEGDKLSGVKNIYTIYGRERGKRFMTIMVVVLFLSPIILLQGRVDLFVLAPISLVASYIFYSHEDHRPIFGMYFLVIVYSLLRYTGYL